MVFKLPHFTLWHMLPIAIGLHGLLFVIPIPSTENEAKEVTPESVNVVNLPKPSPSLAIASPRPTPKAQISPLSRPTTPIANPVPQPSTQPQPQTALSLQPSPNPSPSLSPASSLSPSPSPSPTDALQIMGAVPGCKGRVGCWQMADSNGRAVAGNLEQQLEKQGFTLTQKDLDQDTGFRVYEVAKDGVKQYYLHVIWSDRGTAYIRNDELLSQQQIAALTEQ